MYCSHIFVPYRWPSYYQWASVALITSIVPQHRSAVYFRGMQWPFYPALSPDIGRSLMCIQLSCSQAAFPIIVLQLCFPSMYIWVLSGATSELLLSSVPQSFANCEISGCSNRCDPQLNCPSIACNLQQPLLIKTAFPISKYSDCDCI